MLRPGDAPHGSPLSFVGAMVFIQAMLLVVYFTCVEYDDELFSSEGDDHVSRLYPHFQDVHIMILVGFGFLMTFLKRYGYSSVGLTFMTAAVTIQWYVVCDGLMTQIFDHAATGKSFEPIKISMETPIFGDFCTAAVLISFGALLGKVSPLQLLLIAFLETVFFCINENIAKHLGVVDIGGSLIVHLFGAYFGLAASKVLTSESMVASALNAASYRSDLFAMIGTLFLWCYWPSFNSILAGETARERTILNTVLAISASCAATFTMSSLLHYLEDMEKHKVKRTTRRCPSLAPSDFKKFDASKFQIELNEAASPDPKALTLEAPDTPASPDPLIGKLTKKKRTKLGGFSMVDIQNATLAGGVAVGAVANMVIGPGGAILIGMMSGMLSVGGFVHIQPWLQSKLGLHDTCGVHNLHGLPAVLSGILSIVYSWLASTTDAHGAQYSYRREEVLCDVFSHRCEHHLDAGDQALIQFEYMLISLMMALLGGSITGIIARQVANIDTEENDAFNDDQFWQVAEGTTYGETHALKELLLHDKLGKSTSNSKLSNAV
ncbi:hypothetical protein CYMTET_38498 [Cymbomonas tetramitiformis]|uniref:Ammonium transporter AmtB-like domain-containing protein n=1 Tax=Cymbomonas tetramitiformis TaxID=36881 RepID=A0AAE0CBW2_9CHLO|nr:hypothetical protein CYMTET_38498 [Cymbomonas tetramitiformis]